MAKRKEAQPLSSSKASRRRTPEARENQLIALAYDLVEQRLRDGTATSQETTHFLKMGSAKERREAKLDEMQLELMQAKTEALQATKRMESLYQDAINAVRSYSSPVTMGMMELTGDDHSD